MYALAAAVTLAWPPMARFPGPAQETPAQEGLIAAVARALGIAGEMEIWMSVVLALAIIALFALTWLALLWIPYRIVVALRRNYEQGRATGRELEWLRFRLRDLKKENRLLREKLEEYEPTESRSA